MKSLDSRHWRSPVLWLLVFVGLYAIAMLNWQLEVVRLTSAAGNTLVLLASQILPFVALGIGIHGLRGRRRWVAVFGVLPLVTAAATLGALMGLAWSIGFIGDDAAFARISATRAPAGTVVVYRTNGGATTAYGVVLRQEVELFPGVLLVRRLDRIYPAVSAKIAVIADDTVEVRMDEDDGILGDPIDRTYRLRRLVYI